jgi:membrane-associated phospholipid phosphatase
MSTWQAASAAFFVYVAAVAALLPGVDRSKRRLAVAGSAVGLLLAFGAFLTPSRLLNDWLLPPAALLVAYWTSGLLFVAPMPRAERALLGFDRLARVRQIAAATPRAAAELLEIAYAAVYVVIPIALVVCLLAIPSVDAGRFWAVILVTDYICFGMLPWVQTRPPRALEPEPPWTGTVRVRAFNLRMLGRTSIQVNTFPSGHAAEALAAALLVSGAGSSAVAAMLVAAVSISAGAVLGRYHYAADAVAGWLVALVVWFFL